MGKGCEHHPIHQKSTFLPMFCRLSIKDVTLNHTKDRSDDPSSPKVSCMGQVKRNNRVIGFPTTAAAVTRTINHHPHNYTKLKRLFSSTKTLMPTTSTITTGTSAASFGGRSGSKSCREMSVSNYKRSQMKNNNDRDDSNSDQDCVKAVTINISEMDPPLPVVKRVAPPGVSNDEVNIWKRRFNGVSLQRLQIEEIQLSNNRFLPPTTV